MRLSNETKVGLLAVGVILIFVVGYNFISGSDFFSQRNHFYSSYHHVNGLKTSNPVLLYGHKVGEVENIRIISSIDPKIDVTFSVDDEINIPKTSVAKIISSDILGSKALEIIPGKNKRILAYDGDTLKSEVELTISESVAKVISPVKKKSISLISSIDTVITVFKGILEEGGKRDLSRSLKSLSGSIENLQTTTHRMDTLVAHEKTRLQNIFKYAEEIVLNIRNNNDKLNRIIDNFANISDTLAASKLKQTIKETKVAVSRLNNALAKINEGQGSLGLLINDPGLYENLKKSSADLDTLIRDLNENPDRYVHFSILNFGKKEKKKEKK